MQPSSSRTERKATFNRAGRIYRMFGPYLKPYWGQLLLAYGSLIGVVLATVLKPWPLKIIFDYVLLGKPLPPNAAVLATILGGHSTSLLTVACIAIVLIVFVHSLFSYLNKYSLSIVGNGLISDVRQGVFEHLQTLCVSSKGPSTTGDLILRLTSDVNAIRGLILGSAEKLVRILLTFASTIAVMLYVDWPLALLSLAMLPAIYVTTHHFSRNLQSALRKRLRKEGAVASIVQETLTSLAVVQAFAQEKQEKRRFAEESKQSLQAALERSRLSGALTRSLKVLESAGFALVVWYGARRALAGQLTPGDLI